MAESVPTLIDIIGQFNEETYPIDNTNRPFEKTLDQIDNLTKVEKLCYNLYAKPFRFEYADHQRGTGPPDVNPRPNEFKIGPFKIHLEVDQLKLNSSKEFDDLVKLFEQIQIDVNMNEAQFKYRYGKNINLDILKKLDINAHSTTYLYENDDYANENQMMGIIENHWFTPVVGLVRSYNYQKVPDLSKKMISEYLRLIKKRAYRVSRRTSIMPSDALFVKPNFHARTQSSFASFNVNSKADYSMGFDYRDEHGDLKIINFSMILEGKVPTTNVLRYLAKRLTNHANLIGSFNISDEEFIAGEKNFKACYLKLLKQMICSNCQKAIITDYENLLFMEIGLDNDGNLELNYHLIKPAEVSNFRYLLFSFLTINDYQQEVNNRGRFQEFVTNRLTEMYGNESEAQRQNPTQSSRCSSATTTNSDTTEFSSNLTDEIVFEAYTAPSDMSHEEDSSKQFDVKILGEWPYDPIEIAQKFKVTSLIMFKYNPFVIETSLINEIIEVDSTIVRDLGYNVNDMKHSNLEQKVIIKLAPLESLLIEVNGDESEDDVGGLKLEEINQKKVDSIYHEIQIHSIILKNYRDSFVVKILHFGFLCDDSSFKTTGKLNSWRFNGPFIMMDQIKISQLNNEQLKLLPLRVKEMVITSYEKLHKINIIHNDIKPANLLVTPNGDVLKLIDFGHSFESDKESDKIKEMMKVRKMLGLETTNIL